MTIAYFCVLIASLLPLIWVGVAKASFGFQIKDNNNPREFLSKVSGKALRAKWAQENSWEAFAPFAAAIIIASVIGVDQTRIDAIAISFIGFRVLYGLFYLYDLASLRSLVWFLGICCNFTLYYLAWSHS